MITQATHAAAPAHRGATSQTMHSVRASRPHVAWLAFLATILVGWLAAHAFGHWIAAHQAAGSHASNGGYLATLPALAFAIALLAVGTISGLLLLPRARALPLPSPVLVLVPPAGFLLQEFVERSMQTGHFNHSHAVTEPTLLLCFMLQAPFGVVAYLAAKALLGCVEALTRFRLGSARTRTVPLHLLSVPIGLGPTPTALLSSGHGQRGPPSALGVRVPA
jgi:hypothetical protein